MDIWLIFWLGWIAAFFIIEIPAMKHHGTLSEQVWKLLAKDWKSTNIPLGIKLRRIAFMAFWVWLTAHFFFQFA
jgi:hypothetical protein